MESDDPIHLASQPSVTKSPFLQSIDQAGVDAGIAEAKTHQGELAFQANTLDHGTVKLSVNGRWKFLKAAFFGSYSKDKGAAGGVDGVITLGGR